MATDPIKAIGFTKNNEVAPLAPLKPLEAKGTAIGFDRVEPSTPNPIEGPTPSKQFTAGYIPGTSLQDRIAESQDGWSQFGNFIAQTGIEALVGTVEAASYLADFEQHANKLRGEEQEYSNWLADQAKQLKETARTEWVPVYLSEENQGFQPASAEWWAANGGQGLGSTLSLLIPGVAVSKLGKLAGLGRTGQTVSATLASRYAESTMEANQVYQDAISKGASKEAAGDAASKVWNTNWIFALQDFAQFNAITKGFSSMSKGAKGTGFGQLIGQMASEGAEEAGQYVVAEEARKTAMDANVDYFGAGFNKRLIDYVNDDEFATSTLLGAIGGGVFHAAGKIADTVFDTAQGNALNNVKQRVQKLFSRGIQKEVANAIDDKVTSQAITNIDFGQQFLDNFNKGRLPQYKSELEELKKTPDLAPEAKQSIDTHIQDIDFLMTEEAKLRNSNTPQDLFKPILLKKLELNQNFALAKQAENDLNEVYTKVSQQELNPALIDAKKAKALAEGYKVFGLLNPEYAEKAVQYAELYQNLLATQQLNPVQLNTQSDDKINTLTYQLISINEKKAKLQAELSNMTTPEGVAAYRQEQVNKKINEEATLVLNNPNATREQLLQAEKNATDPDLKIAIAKRFQELQDKERQTNVEKLQDVVDSVSPPYEGPTPDDITPDMFPEVAPPDQMEPDVLPPDFDPNMDMSPDDIEPEVDFAGGISTQQANRWGLTPKETQDLVSKVDIETRQPKPATTQQKEKEQAAKESIRSKTSVSTTALNANNSGNPIVYHNNITGEVATPEQIFAVDNATGQLIINTPRIQPGIKVILRLENDFPWTQQPGFKPSLKDNFTINVYLEGVQRPITQLRNADNKYLKADEKQLNSTLRDAILSSPNQSIETTIADKNIGTPRTDNVFRSVEVLESDFMIQPDGRWGMQVLPHNPILGLIDHNGIIHTPNIGAMKDINKNPNIENRVEEAKEKYITKADLAKLAGKTVAFRTAPDGTLRALGQEYRGLTTEEIGWVRNNLSNLINTQEFTTLKEVIYIPTHPSGVYKHTNEEGRPKTPDVVKLDRFRFHIVNTGPTHNELLIPIKGKSNQKLWVVVADRQLNDFLNSRPFSYRIVDGQGNKSPVRTEGGEKIAEAFDKLLVKQYKNINEANLNSEIQYTDPVTQQVYPTFYDYLVKTSTLQTKLKGSITMGTGEDTSYSFNQVSLYLDPNPSKVTVQVTPEETITTLDEPQQPKPSEDKTKAPKDLKKLMEELYDEDAMLKPATREGYVYNTLTDKELNWFRENIGEDYLVIAKNVDSFVSTNGVQAFGQYYNSLVTVAELAPAGTIYHEAGHFLFDPKNGLITAREREKVLDEGSKVYNIKRSNDKKDQPKLKPVDYKLRAIEILQSPKAEEIFKKGEKNKWDLNKILTELAVPKEQKEILLSLNTSNREELIQVLAQQYTYVVEIETSKIKELSIDYTTGITNYQGRSYIYNAGDTEEGIIGVFEGDNYIKNITEDEFKSLVKVETNSSHYSNLTVPGGTNYTENEIKTPDITPSIKGHAQFSTDKGIGWFRSDDKRIDDNTGKKVHDGAGGLVQLGIVTDKKTRRILEVQSDLFQKGRDRDDLAVLKFGKKMRASKKEFEAAVGDRDADITTNDYEIHNINGISYYYNLDTDLVYKIDRTDDIKGNQFLQLLNKDSNWVSFFVKSIVQDSANKGYEKVLFPTGNTASKVEGHETLEEFKAQKESRLAQIQRNLANLERIPIGEDTPISRDFGGFYYGSNKPYETKQDAVNSYNIEIKQLTEELERVETEGFAALKPIFNFYENTVGNTLKKVYKDQIKTIKDEYGNTWYELKLKEEHKGVVKLKAVDALELTGDEQIEEKIMEDFERYKLSDGQYKPKVERSKSFFRRIMQMIKGILGFKSPIEKLFSRMSNVRRTDLSVYPNLEDRTEPAYKLLPGFFKAIQQRDAIQAFASEIMRYANEAVRGTNVDLTEFFTKKDNIDIILNKVKSDFTADYHRIAAIPTLERTREEMGRYAGYLAMGLGKSIIPEEVPANGTYEDIQREGLSPLEGFRTKVLKELGKWGFRVRLSDRTIYETPQSDDAQTEKQELKDVDEAERLYDIDSTQINPTDSLSQRVRLFLSTIPEPVTDREGRPTSKTKLTMFGTPKYLDFRRVDATLTLQLANAIDPLTRLEILSRSHPTAKVVLDRLMDEKNKGNDQVYTEFFVKYRRDSYTKKSVLIEKVRQWVKPEDRTPGGSDYQIVHKSKLIDTDRNSVDRVLLNKWREEGIRKRTIDTDGTVVRGKAAGLLKEIQETKAKGIKGGLTYKDLKEKFESILKAIGVELPVQLWEELEALKPGEKASLLQNWTFGVRKHSLEDMLVKYGDGTDPFSGSNIISDLARRVTPYVENLSRGAYLNESGDQEYPNNTPSYITEFVNNALENPEDVVTSFQQDEFYAGNAFLSVIRDKAARSSLELEFTSAIREGERDAKDFQDRSEIESLIMRFTAYHNNAADTAFINVGTPSDKTKQPMLALPKYKGTRAKDFLTSVLNRNIDNESVRIQRLKKYIGSIRKDQPLPTDIKNLKDAVGFKYIPALDSVPNLSASVSDGGISPEQFKAARQAAQPIIEKFITDEYELFLKYLESNDLITTKKNGSGILEVASATKKMPEGILYDHKGIKGYTHEAFLKEFFYNDLAWRFEVSKVLQGDIAFYSSQDDYFKRQYQLVTPGYRPLAQKQTTVMRGVYGKQFKINDEAYLMSLVKLIKPTATKADALYKEVISKYEKVNKTDAQSLMTIDAYKALAEGLGQWTKDHDTIYELAWRHGIPVRRAVTEALAAGLINEDQATTYRVMAGKILLQPFKPFVFRDVPITLPDGKIMLIKEQVKDSITVITPEMSNVSKGYKDLLAYMKANQIDIMSAEDTIKVGSYGVINDFTVPAADWQKRPTLVEDFKFPQFIPDKKKEEVSGTQTHKLVLGNIAPTTEYSIAGKNRNGKQVIENYNEYWTQKLEESSEDLKKRLGITRDGLQLSEDPKKRADQLFKLHLLLKQELGEREINENYWDVLDLIKRGAEQVDFTLPLSFPAFGPKFQSILTNLWKKQVIKQKSPGYSAVNLADFGVGYSDELKFVQNDNGEIVEAEIGLPIDYVGEIGLKYGEHLLPNGTILWDKLNENQKESLQFILYRIPTSNKSSMLPVRVVRITPPQLNNIVMIPGELTVQQGLDFDVDKSQLIRRVLDKEGKVDKANVDTKLFNLYWGILTNKAHTLELLTPLASPTMESKLEQFRKDGIIESIERTSPLSTTADVQAEVRNKDGKAEIGIASRFNTGHTVLQTIKDYIGVKTGIAISHKRGYEFDQVGRRDDADGVLISTNHAESQQAALDAAKNPLLAYFNVVKGTMAAFHTMLEFGVPLPVAIDFFMQPVIKEWTKFYKQEGQSVSKATEKLFTTYPGVRAQYDVLSKGTPPELTSGSLAANLSTGVAESTQHSGRVILEFLSIIDLSNQMSNINNVISVDTFQDATGLEALQSFIQQKDVATDPSANVYIDPRIFDLENTPKEGKRLAAFFRYGIEDAISYISQFYPSASEEYGQMRDHYAQIVGEETITDKRLIKKLNQFTDYFLMQYDSSLFKTMTKSHPFFNEDPKIDKSDYRLRWSFFDPARSIWKYTNNMMDAKDKDGNLLYPSLQRNDLLKNLESEESRQNEVQVIGVRNTDAQADKTDYINAWWDLITHTNDNVKALGHDLVRYAVQSSAFQYSVRSFYDLIPVQYWVQYGMGGLWDSIVKNPTIDNESAIVNFIRHNFRSLDRFPEIYTQKGANGQLKADAILNTKQVDKHLREFTLRSDYRENMPLPRFVRILDRELDDYRLYESGGKNDPRTFKEVQPLGGRAFVEISADRMPSNHSKVRAQYPNISADPWKSIKREFPLFDKSTPGSNMYLDKYIPGGKTEAGPLLSRLLANESDVQARNTIEVLLKNADKITTPIEITHKASPYAGVMRAIGDNTGGVNTVIQINPMMNMDSESMLRYVLLHELIHAFSVAVVQNPSGEAQVNFVRNINRLREEFRTKLANPDSVYALSDNFEFIAELASNKDLRKELKNEGFWGRLLRNIRKLFGFKDEFDKALDQFYTIVDEADNLQKITPTEFALMLEEKEVKGSKRIGVLQQALSSLQAREKDLRRRWKRTEANELAKERKILEELVNTNRNQAVVRYLLHTEKEVNQLKEIYNNLAKDVKSINAEALNSMRDQLISYDILHTLTDRIYTKPEDFIPEGGDKETMLKQLNQLSADISRLLKKVEKLGVKRFASFIKDAIQDPRSIEEIEDNLTVADKDIVWSSRWTDPGMDVEDPAIKAIAIRLKDNATQAYRSIQEDLYTTQTTDKEVSVVTLEPSAYSLGMHWLKRTVKFKSTGILKALTDYEEWLKKNKPKSDTFADKFSRVIDSTSKPENDDGVHFVSPFSKEGRAIMAIKENSPDYPLRQFYETVVLGYLKSQEQIAEYSLRPGLRIPSIGRGLMEGFLREKGIKDNARMFTEQFLNNFRERFDDADYQPVDQSGRPRQDVALRFTSKQDGQDGRLTTREVSLDIANTVPMFIHEMYNRKGLVELKDDLEIGKSVLAQRRVLKTKRIEAKGLTPFLTNKRDNITLASGEFDYIHGRESKSYGAYDSLVRRFLYGQVKAREGDVKIKGFKASLTKAFDFLLRATGAKLMLFNVAIPLTNYVATEFTFLKEVVGGNIINKGNWLAGQKLYGEAALAGLQDLTRRDKKTHFGRIFTYFNPMDIERPVSNLGIDSNWMRTTFHKLASSGSDLFEYKVAVNAMGAVMDRFKVTTPEGKEVSLYDGLEVTNDGKVTLKSGYSYNGSKTLKPEVIDDVIQYTLRLYQSATGIRNKMDQTAASEFVVGRAVEFMRKWLKPGLNARFKTRHFDEKIHQENEGHYVSSLILYNNIFGRNGWVKNMTDAMKVLVFMNQEDPNLLLLPEELAMSEERQQEIINLRQANIRKTSFELYMIMAMSMLLWFGWDDDTDEDSYLRYMTARVRRELMTFIDPTTAWDVLRSPTVALNTIEGFQKIGSSMVASMGAYVTGEDQPTYISGPYKGQDKLWADIERQFAPFRKQFSELDTKTRLITRGYR